MTDEVELEHCEVCGSKDGLEWAMCVHCEGAYHVSCLLKKTEMYYDSIIAPIYYTIYINFDFQLLRYMDMLRRGNELSH